ncbi:MAG: exonuclease domain-containing protein [Clostridium sp.]|nr:exonuclease domain-containing protein [Clostridium sp.]MCM1460073.1 exonuclease domain-containing protein [Bacteroides sp.]
MNYIVLDLEWNQCYGGHEHENPRMPFEIIEIGAVKLDEKFNITDSYSSIIKPRLYKKLQPHIKAILNYDEATLKKGRPFDMVCREFIKWCDEDYIFCTWGTMDLSYLQNNMDYYYMKQLEKPLKYYNVQQIYADVASEDGQISKLEKAVAHMNLEIDRPFHSAVNDAYYTGRILAEIKPKDLEDRYTYDVYNVPTEKDDEIISYHKHYMEHITRVFEDKAEALSDKELLTIRCYKCGKKASKKVKWFVNSQNTYACVGRCWYHGLVAGRIRFKQTKDGKVFAIKTMLPTDKVGMENIKERQNELREKRQEKRHIKKKRQLSEQ